MNIHNSKFLPRGLRLSALPRIVITGGMLALLLVTPQAANAAARTWSTTASNTNMNTVGNWDTLPVTADSWVFGTSATTTLNNDFGSFTVNGITFNSGASAYTIGGNSISLAGNMVNNSSNLQTVNLDMAMTATRTFTTNANGNLLIGGAVSGGFGLTKDGNGTLTLTKANTYTGTTTLTLGSITFGSSSAASVSQTLAAISVAAGNDATVTSQFGNSGSASLTFGAQTYTGLINYVVNGGSNGSTNQIKLTAAAGFLNKQAFFNGADYAYMDTTNGFIRAAVYGTDAGFSIADNTTKLVSGAHNNITASITGQGSVATNTLRFNGAGALDLTQTGGTTITFNTNSGILRSGGGSTTISGGDITTGNGFTYVVRTDSASDSLTINSNIKNSGTNALLKSGAGTLTLGGANTYTGSTQITNGTVNITGTQSASSSTTVYAATLNLNNTSALSGGTLTVNNPLSSVTENAANAINATTAVSLVQSNGVVNLSQANNFGSGAITLSGGTLTLAGANTITGATAISGGTLALGDKASLGTSTVTWTGGNIQSTASLTGSNKITNAINLTGTGIFNGSNNIEIGGNLTNSGGNRTITSSITGGGALTLDNVYLSEAQATGRTLTFNGTGSTTINAIADSAAGVSVTPATSGLTLNSATQTLTLAGANTYSGTTTVTAGTLSLGNDNALGTSTLSLGTATLQASGGARVLANAITIGNAANTISGSNALTLNGNIAWGGSTTLTVNNSAVTTLGGTFSLRNDTSNAQRTFTLGGTGDTVISGAIVNGSTLNGIVTLSNTGTTTLSGANTYSGATTVTTGTAKLGSSTGLGYGGIQINTIAGGTSVTSGATVDLNGQTGVNEVITLNGTGVGANGALINSNTSTTAIIGNGVAAIQAGAASSGTGYSSAPTVTVTNPVSGTTSTGTATLGVTSTSFSITSGDKFYTAAPTVTITGGGGQTATGTAILSGGTTGTVIGVTITSGGFGFTTAPTIVFSGGTVSSGTVTPTGTGNAANFTVTGLSLTDAGSGYTSTPTVSFSGGGGTGATATATLTSVALGSATSIGGAGNILINAAVTGGNALTKVGAGTLTLAGVNTYTGTTTVSTGSFLVTGSITSAVTANGGTFGGGGSSNAAVTINTGAMLTGGGDGSAGTFTTTNTLTLNSGATLKVDFNSTTASFDKIVTNGLTLSNAILQLNDIGSGGGLVLNQSYVILDKTAITSIGGTFSGLAESDTITSGNNVFKITYVGGTGNDVALEYLGLIAVPEPSTYAAIAGGCALLGAWVIRRRKATTAAEAV